MIAVHFVPMLKGTVAPKSKVFSVVLFIHLVCTGCRGVCLLISGMGYGTSHVVLKAQDEDNMLCPCSVD